MSDTCGLIIDDGKRKILLQLRDNKKGIAYPNCWGIFGGHIEKGETPEKAIKREIKEELNYELNGAEYFGNYPHARHNIFMFRKVDANIKLKKLKVAEGQRAEFFSLEEIRKKKCAFNTLAIVEDYVKRFYN